MSGLLETLKSVTETDYEEIVRQIAEKEQELDCLNQLEKIIGARLGKQKIKRGPGGRAIKSASDGNGKSEEVLRTTGKGSTWDAYRQKMKEYIMANGPSQTATLSRQCGVPMGSMAALIDHSMFIKTANGVGLSENHR